MPGIIDKVTAFITRPSPFGQELLLFHHPYAGNQIPAGTVEIGETPEQAVIREVAEETGLRDFAQITLLDQIEVPLPETQRLILNETLVYARPDPSSFAWAHLRRGLYVELTGRSDSGFQQASWIEYDRFPDPQYISMLITGWIPNESLAGKLIRHFFRLEFSGETSDQWQVFSDHHTFSPFWAPLATLPSIISPQDEWLKYLR